VSNEYRPVTGVIEVIIVVAVDELILVDGILVLVDIGDICVLVDGILVLVDGILVLVDAILVGVSLDEVLVVCSGTI
jgi:hypothetical protein